MATLAFVSRLKSSGHIRPSLLLSGSDAPPGGVSDGDSQFSEKVVAGGLVDPDSGIMLKNDGIVANDFENIVKLASTESVAHIADVQLREKTLVQRRAIVLAIVGATSADNLALKAILKKGFLFTVKSWLDDILQSGTGGVDLLLHLLSNIALFPVTKEMVTTSKLGKQVAAVEKHKICLQGMNQSAIKERVANVKEEWSASVKRMKKANGTSNGTSGSSKRSLEDHEQLHANKKSKANNQPAKKSSLSSYLQQVSSIPSSDSDRVPKKTEEKAVTSSSLLNQSVESPHTDMSSFNNEIHMDGGTANSKRNVKWADIQGGGPLSITHQMRNNEVGKGQSNEGDTALKDSKKRDRQKELLQKARKSKLVDQNDSLDTMAMMFSSGWRQPPQLAPDPENPPVQVNSDELNAQMRRILSTLPVSYLSEEDVPSNPTQLSEVEQALDMANQASAVPQSIPLFVGQPDPVPVPAAPAPAPVSIPSFPPATLAPPLPSHFVPPPVAPVAPPSVATADMLQSMGLPLFLVGQNTQALQTLASSPGLLSAFVDINGNYDQIKIMNLVQTLTTNLTGSSAPSIPVPPPPPPQPFGSYPPATPNYGQQFGATQTSQYQVPPPQASHYGSSQGHTSSASNRELPSTEGNLHLSGYGPMTTPDSMIALFAPYVKVDEVVPKNGFMFLNTSDPEGAKRAKEALTGVMVGGGPLRINPAVRRNKNSYGDGPPSGGSMMRPSHTAAPVTLPRNALGQIDYDAVRDDRGNVATRNLFVAGYGPSTTEAQLRDCFAQHCQVTGIVMKGTFSFINTAERNSAIDARSALSGTDLCGGSLRINFAKETGRLGTSFDNGQSKHRNNGGGPPSYYGRSY